MKGKSAAFSISQSVVKEQEQKGMWTVPEAPAFLSSLLILC
jgi:hypothetical protein